MPRLVIVVASTRPRRVGPQVGEWFADRARHHGQFDVDVVDLAALALPLLDEPYPAVDVRDYANPHTRGWSATVDAADAFVFVMPEYNHGFTAPLKNALDYLYYEWHYKPVAFVSYGMTSAGLRAVQMVKPVVAALKMLPVTEAVSIHLRQSLDADGRLIVTEAMDATAAGMLDELGRLTTALSAMRASDYAQ